MLETLVFLALGSFGTLGPKLSHGTSLKFADVRTHQGKFFRRLYLQSETFPDGKVFLLQSFSNWICFFLKKEVGQTSNLSDYYNLPDTASNNSWIFAWLLPPAMAMSGLPPPRPSTI